MTQPTAAMHLAWQIATIREIKEETSTARTLILDVPAWQGHLAGQHVNVRLIGEGNGKERSFSIASPPEDPWIALTIERLPQGEVSSHLCGDVRPGFQFELRGPIGRTFVWRPGDTGPLFFVAGGSGIVPLMSMLRQRARIITRRGSQQDQHAGARLLYSSRRWDDIIYREELARLVESDSTLEVTHTITREPPARWPGFRRRIDRAMLEQVAWRPSERPRIYVCGPSALVDSATAALVELGHSATFIVTERFGPTGGQSPSQGRSG